MELKGFSEFLNEMSTIFRNNDVLCTVNPGFGRIGDSYFKLYDSNSLRTATKVARIKFTEPKYEWMYFNFFFNIHYKYLDNKLIKEF